MEFKTSIELGGHIEAANGECIDAGIDANANGQANIVILVARTGDDLSGAKSAALELTTLAIVVLAGPATAKGEARIRGEGTDSNITPVPVAVLLWRTLVHGVVRAWEGLGASPTQTEVEGGTEAESSGSLLDTSSGDQKRNRGLHLVEIMRYVSKCSECCSMLYRKKVDEYQNPVVIYYVKQSQRKRMTLTDEMDGFVPERK